MPILHAPVSFACLNAPSMNAFACIKAPQTPYVKNANFLAHTQQNDESDTSGGGAQYCASQLPQPGDVIPVLIDRFEVWDFFEPDDAAPHLCARHQQGDARPEHVIACAEEMMRVLLMYVVSFARVAPCSVRLASPVFWLFCPLLAGLEARANKLFERAKQRQ
jgi:hypothetical protein